MNQSSAYPLKSVAIFVSHYTIDNSPSILNFLKYLSSCYHLTLFVRRVKFSCAHALAGVQIVELDDDLRLARISLTNISKRILSVKTFDRAICFDPHGFMVCSIVLPFVRPVYYSLELYVKNDCFGLHYPWWIRMNERIRINSILGLIIQSAEKDEIFRRDYGLSLDIPTFLLPVTYDGPSSSVKSYYLRNKFAINKEVKVALHLGGIAEWFACIELALAFSRLSNWILIFHGYSSPEYLIKLQDLLRTYEISNVYVNDEQYAELEMVDEVVKSCDLGIAWYNDLSVGFRTAGHSSGKIPAYMRFGLPVVAKRYRSTVEAIEAPGAGLCVDTMEEIAGALEEITFDYQRYSADARSAYDRCNNFQSYVAGLDSFLDSCYVEVAV